MTIRWDAFRLYDEAREMILEIQEKQASREEAPPPEFPGFSEDDFRHLRCALAKVNEAIDMDPLIPRFHLLAIQIAVLLGNQEEISATFEYALSLFPDDSRIRGSYASYLIETKGKTDEAERILEKGLVRSPENVALRMETAELRAFNQEKPESAMELVLRVLKIDDLPTGIIDYLVLFSFRLEKEGALDSAIGILEKIMARSPNALENAVPHAVGKGLGEPALSLIRRMLEKGDAPRLFHLYEVFLCVLLDRYAEAEAKLDTPVLVETSKQVDRPEFPRLMQCFILIGRGQLTEGVEGFFSLLEEYPLCLEAYAKLFECYEKYPDAVDGIKLLDRVNHAKKMADDPAVRQWLYRASIYLAEHVDGMPKDHVDGMPKDKEKASSAVQHDSEKKRVTSSTIP